MALTSMVAVCISTVFFYSQSRALHFFEVASCCWSVLVNGHRSVPGRLTVDFASDCLDERSRRGVRVLPWVVCHVLSVRGENDDFQVILRACRFLILHDGRADKRGIY